MTQFQTSAGGVVYKKKGGEIVFLLRQSSLYNDWSLPKGWLDDENDGTKPGPMTLGKTKPKEEDLQRAAMRETREEAGADVELEKKLKSIRFWFFDKEKNRVCKTVIFYLMKYLSDLPQGHDNETSEIKWVTLEQAKELLGKRKSEYEVLSEAYNLVNENN